MKFYSYENQTADGTVTPTEAEWVKISLRVWLSGHALYQSLLHGETRLRTPSMKQRSTMESQAFATVHHGLLLARYRPRHPTNRLTSPFTMEMERNMGLLGSYDIYVRTNPELHLPAAWKIDWERNRPAQQTVFNLIQQGATLRIPYNLLAAGLLTNLPAEEFSTFADLPADLTAGLADALIESGLDGLTLEDFAWDYSQEHVRPVSSDRSWLTQLKGVLA